MAAVSDLIGPTADRDRRQNPDCRNLDRVPGTGWLATSAGNVYSFNAPFYGSEAGKSLPGPITGIVADGIGYLLVGRDGSVYNFNTPFYGSQAGQNPPSPVIGITAAG